MNKMSIRRATIYFKKPGKANTAETLKIALNAAKERGIDTVLVASTTGWTAEEALKQLEGSGLRLIVVTHQTGYQEPGVQLMPSEVRNKLEEKGVMVYTGTDVLTRGAQARIEGRLPMAVPLASTIIGNTLRMFSKGVKACVEIAVMAADAGLIPIDKSVVAVAGTHAGSDSAVILTPANSNNMRDLKIHEILAKPL